MRQISSIVRVGAKNSRVMDESGRTELVPNETLRLAHIVVQTGPVRYAVTSSPVTPAKAVRVDLPDFGVDLSPVKAVGTARTEHNIMLDINNVYGDLSPENLTCDGELPHNRVMAKKRQLEIKLNGLFKELGREVSEEESWDWWTSQKTRV